MSLRRIFAILVILLAAWLFWDGFHAVDLIVSRGSSLSDALLSPPTSMLRLLATGILVLGGLMVALGRGMGRWIMLIGTVLFCLLAGVMAGSGADISLWRDEAVWSAVLLVLTGGVLFTKDS